MTGVSVVLITCNDAEFLPDAIESTLQQDYAPLEIIVVDDGSTDGTGDVVQSRYGGRVRYICRENGGPSAARNTGIAAAQGNYLCFLDSDDRFLPGCIRRHAEFLDRNGSVQMVCGNAEYFGEGQGPVDGRLLGHGDRTLTYGGLVRGTDLVPGVNTFMLRRGVLDVCGLFDEEITHFEDLDFWLRVARHAPIVYLDGIVAHTRVHGGNHSRQRDRMYAGLQHVLRKQLTMGVSAEDEDAIRSRLKALALHRAWECGDGAEARRVLRAEPDVALPIAIPPWAVWLGTFVPYSLAQAVRRTARRVGLLRSHREDMFTRKRA